MARVRKEGAVRKYKLRICVAMVRQFRARRQNGQSNIQMWLDYICTMIWVFHNLIDWNICRLERSPSSPFLHFFRHRLRAANMYSTCNCCPYWTTVPSIFWKYLLTWSLYILTRILCLVWTIIFYIFFWQRSQTKGAFCTSPNATRQWLPHNKDIQVNFYPICLRI